MSVEGLALPVRRGCAFMHQPPPSLIASVPFWMLDRLVAPAVDLVPIWLPIWVPTWVPIWRVALTGRHQQISGIGQTPDPNNW